MTQAEEILKLLRETPATNANARYAIIHDMYMNAVSVKNNFDRTSYRYSDGSGLFSDSHHGYAIRLMRRCTLRMDTPSEVSGEAFLKKMQELADDDLSDTIVTISGDGSEGLNTVECDCQPSVLGFKYCGCDEYVSSWAFRRRADAIQRVLDDVAACR